VVYYLHLMFFRETNDWLYFIRLKKEEEAELQKVLKEYSERFKDFDKSTK